MAALLLLLGTEATTVQKTNTTRADAIRLTTEFEGHELFKQNLDSRIKTHDNKHKRRRGDRKSSNGKRLLGH